MTQSSRTSPTKAISPLRQRMIEDMTMRKLKPRTQEGYLRSVKRLARWELLLHWGIPSNTARQQAADNFRIEPTTAGHAYACCQTRLNPGSISR